MKKAAKLKNAPVYRKDLRATSKQQQNVNAGLFLLAVALCFTGIGLLVGVPMIYMILKSEATMGCWEANCPVCENKIYLPYKETELGPIATKCPFCKKNLIFKDKNVMHHI